MTQVEPVKTPDQIVDAHIQFAQWDAKHRVQMLAKELAMQPRLIVLPPLVREWLGIDQLTEEHISSVEFTSKYDAPMIVIMLGSHGRLEHTASLIRHLEIQYGDVTKTKDFLDAKSREYMFGAIVENEGMWSERVKCNLIVDVRFKYSQFCRVVKEEVGVETVTKYEQRIECDPAPGTVIEALARENADAQD